MQKQHLEMVQRLFCWSVRCCNVPTEHQRLKQYHSPPVYFGTCSFKLLLTGSQCSPHRLLSRGHYLPRTCPKWTAINWNLSPQMLRCEIRVLSYGTREKSAGVESRAAGRVCTWPSCFLLTLRYCKQLFVPKFCLKELPNSKLVLFGSGGVLLYC